MMNDLKKYLMRSLNNIFYYVYYTHPNIYHTFSTSPYKSVNLSP